jgi:hypothetical protein
MLQAKITRLGYGGSLRTVYRYLRPLRAAGAAASSGPARTEDRRGHQLAATPGQRPGHPREQLLAALRAHCFQPGRLADHVTSFAQIMTARTGERDLPGWLDRVDADDQPELRSFAAGIRLDLAAVTAGLTLPYSSGIVEGNVNRLLRPSRGRCTVAPASTSCASASCVTPRDRLTNSHQSPDDICHAR